MLAGVYRGRGQVRAEKVAVPEPRAGEVRLRVEACGLCGSDLHIFHSEPDRVRAGMTLGHELVGIVDAVGEGVDRLARSAIARRSSRSFRAGDASSARRASTTAAAEYGLIGLHRPGGFAERVVAPARRLYAVPRELDSRVAALAEPVAVCVHGLRLGRFDAREPLLVLGAGSIGLLTVAVARLWGATDIAITARHAHQARVARELGATATLDPASIRGAAPSTATFPLVVETVGGHADTLLDAAAAVAPGGRIVVLGVFQDEVQLDPWPLLFKEATLTWSLCYTRPDRRARTSRRRCVCSPRTPTFRARPHPPGAACARSIARSRSPTTSRAAR